MKDFDLRKYLAENRLLKESLGSDPKYYVKYTTQDGETAKSGLMSKREAIYKERDLVDSGVKKSSVYKFIKNVDLNGKPYIIDTELDKEIDYRKDEKGRPIDENKILKEAEYTEFIDDGENQFMDLDYNKIRAYISDKKGPDFADDFIDGYNDDFYENVVRFLDKIENPTDEEVLNFVDIEIEKYIPAPNAPGGRGLS
tara:strand:- start:68 stop:661 length:594 start_codon:yes stop_codon:yes gene_type:complete